MDIYEMSDRLKFHKVEKSEGKDVLVIARRCLRQHWFWHCWYKYFTRKNRYIADFPYKKGEYWKWLKLPECSVVTNNNLCNLLDCWYRWYLRHGASKKFKYDDISAIEFMEIMEDERQNS